MKSALLLNVKDPKIRGVMVMGDRGTGESTTQQVPKLIKTVVNCRVGEGSHNAKLIQSTLSLCQICV